MFFSNPILSKVSVDKHKEAISKASLWPFIVASHLESDRIASIYNYTDERYELEDENGISIAISAEPDGLGIYMFNSLGETTQAHFKIEEQGDIEKCLKEAKSSVKRLTTKPHLAVKKNEVSVLKNIVKERIMNKKMNFDDFVTVEQNKAYGEAFFELIESGQIYEFDYFSKKRKVNIDQLPKDRLIDPVTYCDLANIKVRTTSAKTNDEVMALRASRLSSVKLTENASWSKYDSERGVQVCADDFIVSEFPVESNESRSFYINAKKDKILDISNNFVLKKVSKALNPNEKAVVTVSGKVPYLNNLVTALAKGCFLSKYLYSYNGESTLDNLIMPIDIDGHIALVDSKSAYYGIREIIYFIKDGETFDLSLYSDRIIISTTHGKKISLSAKQITREQSKDPSFLYSQGSIYKPLSLILLMNKFKYYEDLQESKPEIKKPRILSKINSFISVNSSLKKSMSSDYLINASEQSKQLKMF